MWFSLIFFYHNVYGYCVAQRVAKITLDLMNVTALWSVVSGPTKFLYSAFRRKQRGLPFGIDERIAKEEQLISSLASDFQGELLAKRGERLLIESEFKKSSSESSTIVIAAVSILLGAFESLKGVHDSATLWSFESPFVLGGTLLVPAIIYTFILMDDRRVLRRLAWVLCRASELSRSNH